jgi:hypothetical protein
MKLDMPTPRQMRIHSLIRQVDDRLHAARIDRDELRRENAPYREVWKLVTEESKLQERRRRLVRELDELVREEASRS